jgi:hypothetical protein
MSYIKIAKIVKETVEVPEKGYVYFGYDTGGLWLKDDDGTPAYYILAGYGVPPSLISASPTSGYVGQTINLYGTGFIANATAVYFSSTSANTFSSTSASTVTVLSPTQLTVVVPNIPDGIYFIYLITQYGTSSFVPFTINPQTVLPIITPPVMPSIQMVGSNISLNGLNFEIGTKTYFNFVQSPSTVVQNSTYLSAQVPQIATGTTSVFVTTSQGSSNTVTMVVTDNSNPTITDFSPKSGVTGTTISISGINFVIGLTPVLFGATPALNVNVNSGTFLTADVPNMQVGPTSIYVANSSLTGFTVLGTNTGQEPYIASIMPLNRAPGQTVTLSGTNVSNVTTVTFNGISATISPIGGLGDTITVTIPSNTSSGDNVVYAYNSFGQSNAFTYSVYGSATVPVIVSFNPTSGYTGDIIVLSGNNFTAGQSQNNVKFQTINSPYTNGLSTTQLQAQIPSTAPSGSVEVVVTNINGSGSKSGFIINTVGGTPPTVTSVSGPYGNYGKAGDVVDIYGTYLIGDGSTSVGFGTSFPGVSASANALSPTHITATIPTGVVNTPGTFNVVNVYVRTVSGSCTYTPFEVYSPPVAAPTITNFYPTSGSIGDIISLTGTNFCKYFNYSYVGVIQGSPPKPVKVPCITQPWISNTYMQVEIPPEVGSYTGQSGFEVDNTFGDGGSIAGFTLI